MRFLPLFIVVLIAGCAAQNRPAQLVGGAGPVYPAEAKENGVEGFVVVSYQIDVDGQVLNPAVVASEPSGVFEAAALKAVSSWRFNPRIIDGMPVKTGIKQSTVTFRLSGSSAYDDY